MQGQDQDGSKTWKLADTDDKLADAWCGVSEFRGQLRAIAQADERIDNPAWTVSHCDT